MNEYDNYFYDMQEISATNYIFILVQKIQLLANCVLYLRSVCPCVDRGDITKNFGKYGILNNIQN